MVRRDLQRFVPCVSRTLLGAAVSLSIVSTLVAGSTATLRLRDGVAGAMAPPVSTIDTSIIPLPSGDKPKCRDSYDTRCGKFYWDPEPANAPLEVEVSVISITPTEAGDVVEIRVVASDSDHQIDRNCFDVRFGTQNRACGSRDPACDGERPYGPWSPPPKEPDRFESHFMETFADPGTYEAAFQFFSSPSSDPCPPGNPYESRGYGSVSFSTGG